MIEYFYIIKSELKYFITIFIELFIIFSVINPNNIIKADNIKKNFIQKKIEINNIENKVLINNGWFKVNRKTIFKENTYKIGSRSRFLKVNNGGFIVVTQKEVESLPKNTPAHVGKYKLSINKIKEGKIEWNKIYGYKGMNRNNCTEIKSTNDNGYIMIGECSEGYTWDDLHKLLVVKLDRLGRVEWEKIWGPENGERSSLWGVNVMEIEEGYIVIGTNTWGSMYSKDKNHFYIIKLDKNGNEKWRKDLERFRDYQYVYRGFKYRENEIAIIMEKLENKLTYVIMESKLGKIKEEIEYKINENYKGLAFYESDMIKLDDNNRIIVGELKDEDLNKIGIYIMDVNNEIFRQFRVYWNDNNKARYIGKAKFNNGNYILYGELNYKNNYDNSKIFIMKFNKSNEVNYIKIFSIDVIDQIRGLEINDKRELIGLFEWSTIENGKYNSYISIEKITVK